VDVVALTRNRPPGAQKEVSIGGHDLADRFHHAESVAPRSAEMNRRQPGHRDGAGPAAAGGSGPHQWIVRLTIGQKVPAPRPAIERLVLTTSMTARHLVDLIRHRTAESAALISSLTDDQLALPTRPARARGQVLADTIGLVLIGHYHARRRDIERKLQAAGMRPGAVHSYWDYARRFLDWREGIYPRSGASRPVPIRTLGVGDLRADVAAYAQWLDGAGLSQAAIDTYVRHADFFVRWLDGEFEPGARLRRRPGRPGSDQD
jgi:hypothetical protein